MRNPIFYVLLLVLLVLDGWLLAHPNLIGRAGVFFFNYDYLATFPKALGTVTLLAAATILVTTFIGRLGQPVAIAIMAGLLAASAYWLISSFTQYNTGIYKATGAGFRAGAILLPGICLLIFGEKMLHLIQNKPSRV